MTQLSLPLNSIQSAWIAHNSPVVLSTMRGREFSADDLRGVIEEPCQPNWWGVMLAKLRNAGQLERVGYRQSGRRERNGGVVAVWRVK